MIAALGAQEAITENITKLKAARNNLENNILFNEHETDVFVLQLVSDVVRSLEFVKVAP